MSRCNAAFKKRILLLCYDALEAEGFTRFRKEDVDCPIHDGFHCWVGLNTGLYSDRLDIVPNVGLHVVPIEKLCAQLERRKYNRGVATYAVNMGVIPSAAEERAFAFGPQQSDAFVMAECKRLARLYATSGLEYATSIASYEALLPLLREGAPWLGGKPESYAVGLYLAGQTQEACAFVKEFVKEQPVHFRDFAAAFLEYMAQMA